MTNRARQHRQTQRKEEMNQTPPFLLRKRQLKPHSKTRWCLKCLRFTFIQKNLRQNIEVNWPTIGSKSNKEGKRWKRSRELSRIFFAVADDMEKTHLSIISNSARFGLLVILPR